MHDLVIRGATVVDGTGAPARTADVAAGEGRIRAVGRVEERGRREVDADGLLVTPGFVDIHTHYDGQATWDPWLAPSSWHGVTTAVFGNCGVGFAPVRPGSEPWLISLMEGVEDIPGSVLAEGIEFRWESFPEYLDVLESLPRVMDVGAQVPHGALRFHVMGERGADHAARPGPEERARMGRLLEEALGAGALGFTTSRTVKHRAADGRPTPSLSALPAELGALADAMRRAGRGVIECNSDFGEGEIELLCRMSARAGRPLSVLLLQIDADPGRWRRTLAGIRAANAAGLEVRGQVGCRPIGILMGLGTSVHPFLHHPLWPDLAPLSGPERARRITGDPALRRRLVEALPHDSHRDWMVRALEKTFPLGSDLDYEPAPEGSVGARARAGSRDPFALALELMLEKEGEGLLLHPFENYAGGDLEVVREMLLDPHTVCGLGDGGAHVATICDASYPTFLLTHWARDRSRGERIALEHLVRKQCRDTALSYGLRDRGVLAPGYKADINVIDFERLRLTGPRLVHDLPAGGRRLVQGAEGYRHTFVSGVEVACDGEATGERPGRLVRGAQDAPPTG